MDFGAYLKSVLDEKNVNLSKLSAAIGVKSKNTFYRLFDNYYSYDKTKEITDKIIAVVSFTETEKTRIYELMKSCRIKKNALSACRLLEKLYQPPTPADTELFRSGNSIWCRPDCKEIHMFMGYTDSDRPIAAAQEIFKHPFTARKTLKHFVDFSKNELYIAGTLFALIRLSSHNNYECTEIDNIDFHDLIGLVKLKDSFGLFFVNNQGKYIESPISEELYSFMLEKYNSLNGKDIRFEKGRVSDYASIITEFSVVENNDCFSFEGVFCFGDIPFDTMYRLLADANYLGLSPDNPYIENIIEAQRTRYNMHLNSRTKRAYVLSRERVEQFLKTGRTMDHFEYFRNLTKDEVISFLNHFIQSERFEYRFFKPEFGNHCIECGVVENDRIFIWDSENGYGKNHFHLSIENPRAIRLYSDFCDYFWDFCTLSAEESTEIMKDILENTDICSEQ